MLVDIFSSLDFYHISEGYGKIDSFLSYFSFYMGGMVLWPNKGGFWISRSNQSDIYSPVLKEIFQIVVDSKGYRFGGFSVGCISVFCFIMGLNFGGMVPGSCSVSSHLSVGLSLALIWWAWCVMSGYLLSWKSFLAHLLPLGTPFFLCPLMVLIETVSILIRPVTLAVRLVANITMGHLMLSLVGEHLVGKSSVLISAYVLFEFFVCGLQAYVFTLLGMLYSGDHPDMED
uniref:ATP synthase subunit a n=1 Tax=Rectidens sumatrensis TaxID=1903498 RepID=A0A8A3WP47_9BIVA|nr:ATP synthase F0 subunit 6 [Rectidens sumatrensis]